MERTSHEKLRSTILIGWQAPLSANLGMVCFCCDAIFDREEIRSIVIVVDKVIALDHSSTNLN